MYDEKLVYYYNLGNENSAFVLFNEDEEVIKSDTCISPMYSEENCINTVFEDRPNIAMAINNAIANGQDIEEVCNSFDIELETIELDDFSFDALYMRLDKENLD